jgi:hypothetical protein
LACEHTAYQPFSPKKEFRLTARTPGRKSGKLAGDDRSPKCFSSLRLCVKYLRVLASWRLDFTSEHEIHGAEEKAEGDQVAELEGFLEDNYGKYAEDYEGDDFLEHFELEGAEAAGVTDAVGRHHQAVFKKSNTPTEQDSFPQWPALLLQVIVPGKGHEDVGSEEKKEGSHGVNGEWSMVNGAA